ncbi:MAG: hypothetical protein GXY44_13040 [Phycisphaerales bacterium]|nr:hypothetical protein [Phycisphaerales bacterium]
MLDYVENTVDGQQTPVSKYDYVTDNLGRRTNVVHSGTAFTQHNLVFGYNDRNELTSADRWQGTAQTTPTAAPFAFEYAYDPIGNRETFRLDDAQDPTIYAVNNLNQYTGTTDPSETFVYDPSQDESENDGNLLQDGRNDYAYDAENRLIRVEPRNPSANDYMYEFSYDYVGRRVEKRVYTRSGSSWTLSAALTERFVWDGWNVVMVLNGNNVTQSWFTWGIDLSGSLQAAGSDGLPDRNRG